MLFREDEMDMEQYKNKLRNEYILKKMQVAFIMKISEKGDWDGLDVHCWPGTALI